MLSAQRRGKRPREFQPEPGGRLRPKRAFQLARGRESSPAGWPLGSIYTLGPGLSLGTVVPGDLVWLGLKRAKPWEGTTWRMGTMGPTREELREGVQTHGNSAWSRSKLASERNSGQFIPGGSAAEKKASIPLLPGSFLHSPTRSVSHSANS